MYSTKIATILRRNLLSATQHFKPLPALWRSQKTDASTVEQNVIFSDSAITKSDDFVRSFEDIPGPKKTIKSTVEFYVKSEGFTKGYKLTDRMFAEYGPIFKENLFGIAQVHVIDPDDFEKVFRAEGKYPRRPPIEVWKEHRKRRNFFPGLPQMDGKEWHRVRQGIAPKTMRPKIVEENIDNFNAVTKDAIARFIKLKEACGSDDHIPDLEGELSSFTTESIGTVAFDHRIGLYEEPPKEEALEFIVAVQNFFTLTQKLMFSIPGNMVRPYVDTPTFKQFLKCCDTTLRIAQGFVDKKMLELKEMQQKGLKYSDDTHVPLLTYLLANEALSPGEVTGLAIDTLMGGVDTTANTLLWWLYNLARFPHVQEKLYQEVESVVEKDGDVTSGNLVKLRYLKACLKESMRVTPVTGVAARILDQDVVLSGCNVPAQTSILMELYCASRSQKYFQDPLELKPERWLRENKSENHAFSNLSFGFGARMCVGRRLAELEMYVFVCKLLQRFRLEYHHEPLELYQKLITVPDKPVKIKFVDRH